MYAEHALPTMIESVFAAVRTLVDIKAMAMVEELPETSTVDPEFFKVLLGRLNRVDCPTVMQSYCFAVMSVQRDKLTCKVPSELMVRRALTKMRRDS